MRLGELFESKKYDYYFECNKITDNPKKSDIAREWTELEFLTAKKENKLNYQVKILAEVEGIEYFTTEVYFYILKEETRQELDEMILNYHKFLVKKERKSKKDNVEMKENDDVSNDEKIKTFLESCCFSEECSDEIEE